MTAELLQTFPWEVELESKLRRLIDPNDKVHGLDHIKTVVESVSRLLLEPEFSNEGIDVETLIAGAYLHDVGYVGLEKSSIDSFEHPQIGIEMGKDLLNQIGFDPAKIDDVLYLVLNHDNAKWILPNWHLPSHTARLSAEEVEAREQSNKPGLKRALLLLKEADSKEYTDTTGTQRTFEYGRLKNFPLGTNPNCFDPMNKSTLSNLLIFPHLAWLNATTKKGKLAAARGYLFAELWVKKYCDENSILYKPNEKLEEVIWALAEIPGEVPEYLRI